MKICIAGGSGLLGTALCSRLQSLGHDVHILSRTKSASENTIHWNPANNELDLTALEGLDVLVNLAGENIASGLWTEKKKNKIRESRIQSTALLARSLPSLSAPPKLFLNASAIGYYGDGGSELLTEDSPKGEDFLAEVCQDWEQASIPPQVVATRVVQARIAVILSTKGGALAQALTPFRLGLGGRFGSGEQYFSWISIRDAVAAILHIFADDSLQGAVNLSSPSPIKNSEYTQAFAAAVHRPAFLHLPAWALKLLFGQMAEELFLVSTRVIPEKLLDSGFTFQDSSISSSIEALLEQGI